MTYEFGDYKVRTFYLSGSIFYINHWEVKIYYKGGLIYKSCHHFNESNALHSAKYEIYRHKAILKELSNV